MKPKTGNGSVILTLRVGPRRADLAKSAATLLGVSTSGLMRDFMDRYMREFLDSRGVVVYEGRPVLKP
jgi:hypothetical protein